MKRYVSPRTRLGLALVVSSLVSMGLWGVGALINHDTSFGYMWWNLFLAWPALVFALWLERLLRTKLWSSWTALLATLLWFSFLPNSFYVISDFVHLTEQPRVDIVFDVVMLASFGVNGLILGYLSLYMVHNQLRKRLSALFSGTIVATVLLLDSFAIYIGRDLRWNTWDVIANPASLVFDVSDRLVNVRAHPQVVSITLSFFVFLGSIYVVIWYLLRVARQQKTID